LASVEAGYPAQGRTRPGMTTSLQLTLSAGAG
jgi:hypothetical protein